jgi:hypothetical protein
MRAHFGREVNTKGRLAGFRWGGNGDYLAQPETFENKVEAGEAGKDLELFGLDLQAWCNIVRADQFIFAGIDLGDFFETGELGELFFGLLGFVDLSA